jgi:hypothetical protein
MAASTRDDGGATGPERHRFAAHGITSAGASLQYLPTMLARAVLLSLLVSVVAAPLAGQEPRGRPDPTPAKTPAPTPRAEPTQRAEPAQRAEPTVRQPGQEGEVRLPPRVGAPTRTASLPVGTFMATRIDREALPLTDRVVDEDGSVYLIEFDRMVLALRADRTFRASVRYRRTLFSSDLRGRSRGAQLQNMTVTGTYEVEEGVIRFTPDPSNDTRGLRMLAGQVRSTRELIIPFSYRNGHQARDRTLVMARRDDIL